MGKRTGAIIMVGLTFIGLVFGQLLTGNKYIVKVIDTGRINQTTKMPIPRTVIVKYIPIDTVETVNGTKVEVKRAEVVLTLEDINRRIMFYQDQLNRWMEIKKEVETQLNNVNTQ